MRRKLPKRQLEKIDESGFDKLLDLVDRSFDTDRSILERDLRAILASPETHGCVYGLWVDDILIACVAYGRYYMSNWTGQGGISHLAVDKGFRREGLATQMILQALFDLKLWGAPCATVQVKVGNEVALKIWQRFGFKLYDPACEPDEYGLFDGYVLWFEEDDDD